MKFANFYSGKAGVGCTTTAFLFALAQAEQHTVTFSEFMFPEGDIQRIAGVPLDAQNVDGILIRSIESIEDFATDYVVMDWGTYLQPSHTPPGALFLVTDCSYVSVARNCWAIAEGRIPSPDALMVLEERGVALTVNDVAAAIPHSMGVHTIAKDEILRRAIDAGLLTNRARLQRAAFKVEVPDA